jgi:6-phosphogluconate dehydrogenase
MDHDMRAGNNDVGVIGLAVMGRNLALNMADRGFAVAVYNRTASVTREFVAESSSGRSIFPHYSLKTFLASLKKPRKVMIMVKAGGPVDAVIGEIEPLLEPGDVIMDGGNSYFGDTQRRETALAAKRVRFLGVGISGGEFGARYGPSIMPGGSREAYELVQPILQAIAARVDGEPCVSYLGPGASGHYIKMVHNGIEYGFMQLIADTYALMKQRLGLSNEELTAVYAGWNGAELESYLVEITSKIFGRRDEKTGGYLVDFIRGEAEQLGTGVWSSQSAMDLMVPIPNIDIAVAMRDLSALEDQRRQAATLMGPAAPAVDAPTAAGSGAIAGAVTVADPAGGGPSRDGSVREPPELKIDNLRNALHAGVLITYAQGFAHLHAASAALDFGLRLEDVAAIWRGGCIIRSALLGDIRAAFRHRPELPNLLLDPELSRAVASRREDLARSVQAGAAAGIAVPGMMTALAYLDAYRAEWLPANLIQAQRDYFGAHTYRRTDEEGVFHTDWRTE